MSREPDDLGPYGSESAQNTSTTWLDDFTPVQAKLSGMVDYAHALNTISTNLMNHRMRLLQQMQQVMPDAFAGGFPEVKYAYELHRQNLTEFNTYLQNLFDGIDHTANAAKAIADTYGDSDSFSAISLNTVQFAFADPSAKRPDGLPSEWGKTFSQKAAADEAKTGTAGKPDPLYLPTGTVMNADGGITQTYQDQYGDIKTITISYKDGQQITTTTDPTGTTVQDSTTVSYPLGTYTMTTTTDHGKTSTSTSNSYSTGDTYVTDESDKGVLTGETTVTTNPDGSQTTTTYSYNDGKRTAGTQVTVGADSPVDDNLPDSPADDAENQIRASMPADPPPGPDTKILAPGPLDGKYSDGGSSGTGATTV